MENTEYDSRLLLKCTSNRLHIRKGVNKNETEMNMENGKVIHSAFLPFTYDILFSEYCVQYHLCILVEFKMLRSGGSERLAG
jgi:hypothetical protein